MKIVLATKNPPFYENTLDRKSYIGVTKNEIHDSETEMKDTQNAYFFQYFAVDSTDISDKFNLNIVDLYTRTTYLEPRNFPLNAYPNTFEFWNNVSYAKLIYDNGFIEYCHISSRRCDNLAVNKWYYTFTLDVWNTYWIDTYQQIKALTYYPILISRMHSDRFDYNTTSNLLNFKFLTSQNNAFWNKEQFESSITSKISRYSGKSINPWEEFLISGNDIITQSEGLYNYYRTLRNNNTYPYPQDMFSGWDNNVNGYALALLSSSSKDTVNPWDSSPSYYGVTNTYWITPLLSKYIFPFNDTTFSLPATSIWNKQWFGGFTSVILKNNMYMNLILQPRNVNVMIVPKPILSFNDEFSTGSRRSYNELCYPIRYRDDYASNNGVNIVQSETFFSKKTIKLTTSGSEVDADIYVLGVLVSDQTKPVPSSKESFLNTLSDERIDISNTDIINIASIINLSDVQEVGLVNLLYEPKLYDEELFNIEYSRYGQGSIIISPKWYFYNNINDIINYKSIFLLGYQFVQPHICILTTGPVSGLYRYINQDGSRNLISQFSSQQQTVGDAELQFLVSNRSQLNTGLNNQLRSNQQGFLNSVVGGITGVGAGAVGGFLAGGPVGATAGIAGGLFAGTMGIANNRIQAQNAQDMYNAKLEDLANTPNSTTDNSSESTFKNINTFNGRWKLNWINDVDKQKILAFHQQQGYFLNKFMYIGFGGEDGINSFATRQFYNFWQIPEFKMLIQTSSIAPEYQQYFQNLFSSSGVTLWHTYTDTSNTVHDKVGDYSSENWELSISQYLGG